MARHFSIAGALFLTFALFSPGEARAQAVGSARGGTTTLTVPGPLAARLGLIARGDRADPAAQRFTFEIDAASTLTFFVHDGAAVEFVGGGLTHRDGLVARGPRGACALDGLMLEHVLGPAFEPTWAVLGPDHTALLTLDRWKAGFDPNSLELTLHCPDVRVSAAMADALGDATLAGQTFGTLTARVQATWAGGDEWRPVAPEGAGGAGPRVVGPDMTFCQLYQLQQYGRLGDIVGLAVATTSWNIGDRDLMWFPSPEPQHPFIVMNLYRLKNDRFEQIGQSAVKHGFYALGNTQCGGTCGYEPGHGVGRWLGVGCTDTYSSSLNAAQNGLAPRSEVNPWTGEWRYQGSHFSQGNHSHNAIDHRLQVHDADLDPAQNPGALYYVEGYYAILDDVNVMNSAAWKPVTISGSPGGTWGFSMSGAATRPTIGFAIDAWTGTTKTILAEEVPPIEFVSPDGRCVLAARSKGLGFNTWHYEYALLNVDMHRKVRSFSIPVPMWATLINVDFHAVESHDEPYSNAAWTPTVADGRVTWTTTDNPLRWGTVYNFRFDANVASQASTSVTLGLYEPGTPDSISGLTIGPDLSVPGNAIRGGLLWDEWWTVAGLPAPTGNHPLYPPEGAQSGSVTYRCKECHGWDYKGADGAYGSGAHYTGIRGVYGSTLTANEMYELIRSDSVPNGHGFANYGLSDQDILDLVKFVRELVIDTDAYIDGSGAFVGDPVAGQTYFETGGWISCSACHGEDGAAINFGTPEQPEWIGTVAVHNPWELLHKTRIGQPGSPMPSWLDWGGTDPQAADLGRYCQVSLPVECLENAHCGAGDPCSRDRVCQSGWCVPSLLDGDVNADGRCDGTDIPVFVEAVIAGSTDPTVLTHADFSGDDVMNEDDAACMVLILLEP